MWQSKSVLVVFCSLLIALAWAGVAYLVSLLGLVIENSVFQVFFAIFGVIYAITTGFVLMILVNNHGDVKSAVRLEVNSLRRIRDYLKYVDNIEAASAIRACMRTYCESVLKGEWPEMMADKETPLTTSPQLHELIESLKQIDFEEPKHSMALSKILDTLGDLIVYRSDRLAFSREKLPPMLKHLLIILSVVIVFVFSFLPIQNLPFRLLLNGIAAFALTYIFAIVLGLNNPFTGVWRVTSERLENFIPKIG